MASKLEEARKIINEVDAQMAELFGTKRPAITKHLKNIYASEELEESSTCSILEHMGNDGKQIYKRCYIEGY